MHQLRLKEPVLKPAVGKIRLPYSGTRSEPVQYSNTTWLQPHAVVAAIYDTNKDIFWQKFFGGDHKNVPLFWDAMQHHPSYAEHPGITEPDFRTKMIPLDLHFDGVPITAVARKSSQSAVIYSLRHTMYGFT